MGNPFELYSRLELPLDRTRVFAFFSDAANLALITPPEMGFVIRTPQPIVMREGTLIDYTVRVWGMPLPWRTLISSWNPPESFVDVQLRGPYASWTHTHTFTPLPSGGTLVEDRVLYSLPLDPLGRIAAPLVRRQLNHIWRYREQRVRQLVR